ncbi:MAG: fpvA 2 [Verrucomicrobia bacterium]|nr:fpvA 2 [Verrucomicrobiota bacterium]
MKLSYYVLGGVLAASPVIARAQRAATTPDPGDTPTGETVTLTPFQVVASDDNLYVAGNAISATRINTALADLPFSISAFTPQFIKDTGATSLLEIVSQSAGVKSAIFSTVQGNAIFSVRGFPQAPQRDGFSANALANNYVAQSVIDRVEVVKGPASLLYGAIAPGGTVNYLTKTPQDATFTDLNFAIGSYNFKSVTLDYNQVLIPKKLLFRGIATYESNPNQDIQFSGGRSVLVYPEIKWLITPKASLLVSYQIYQNREAPPALYLPNTNLATPASIVAGLYAVGHPAASSLLVSKTGPGVSQGVNDVSDPGFMGPYPGMPKYFNISDINDVRLNDLKALNAELQATLNEHWSTRAHMGLDTDRLNFPETGHATLFIPPPDSLVYSGGVWSVSPRWTALTPAQQIAEGLAYAQQAVKNLSLLNSTQSGVPTPALIDRAQRVMEQSLYAATVQAEVVGIYNTPTAKYQLLGGIFYDRARFHQRTTQNRSNAQYPFYRSWDVNPASPTYYVNNDEGKFTGDQLAVRNLWNTTNSSDEAAYLLLNATFRNKLYIVGGARYNISMSQVTDHNTGVASQGLRAHKTTPQIGVGYKVTPEIMFYASYSQSYTLSSQPYLTVAGFVNGLPSPIPTTATAPTTGTGVEVGAKAVLFDNKLSATISAYQINVEDVLQNLNTNIQGIGITIWTQGAKQRGNGLEATLTWSPIRNWQVVANVSEEDVRNIKEPVGLEYYLGQHTGYTAKTMANFWTRYDFTSEKLKGLWIGGGVNYTGKNAGDPRNKDYFLPAFTLYNSALGVDFKWNQKRVSMTLNFKNMGGTAYKASPQSIGQARRLLLATTVHF